MSMPIAGQEKKHNDREENTCVHMFMYVPLYLYMCAVKEEGLLYS